MGVAITSRGGGGGGDQELEKVFQGLVNEGVEGGVTVQSELGEKLHPSYLHQSAGSCGMLWTWSKGSRYLNGIDIFVGNDCNYLLKTLRSCCYREVTCL